MTNNKEQMTPDDPFRPTWVRTLIAAAAAVAGFQLPQAVPLEYYPLNHPSGGVNYLEITCAANVQGETDVYLDTGKGFNELEKIRWPLGPSQMAYTYTFPLPDAPLYNLRIDPFVSGPGELTITNFRIVNRRGEEVRRFMKADLTPTHQIEAITASGAAWKLTVGPRADDPYSFVKLGAPVIPNGMNRRNLERCLLSTGYLGLMLWILLLAVYFASRQRVGQRRSVAKAALFLAFLALLFSLVGNRGLSKNSLRYARATHWKF